MLSDKFQKAIKYIYQSYTRKRILSGKKLRLNDAGLPIFFQESLNGSSYLCKTYLIGAILGSIPFTKICKESKSLSGIDYQKTYYRVLQGQRMGMATVHFCMLSSILDEDWIVTYLRGDAFVKSIGLDLSQKLTITKVKELHKRYLDELGEVNALPDNE